ncbi:5192_t:CDS:2, partial [Cetraspora pellucida]
FKDLQRSDGPHRFTIEKAVDITQLPKSHTCFNRIDLPQYKTFKVRLYNPDDIQINQKMFLERFNHLFAYNCDFNTDFSSSTTSVSDHDKKRVKDTNVYSAISVSDDDSDSTDSILSEEVVTKFKAKVIIELDKSDSIPAKWFTFELDNFGIFQDSLVKHIQICINDDNFDKDDIQVSYKINSHGQSMALDNKDDYDAFIIECRKLVKSNKSMVLNIAPKLPNNKQDIEILKIKTKKLKTDFVLKESKLNANEIEIAAIITQIRTKYNCQIHAMPCYIEDGKHLPLIPSRLHLWARDIVTFGIVHAIKVNTQAS